MNELIELWIKATKERELEELPKEINDLYDYTVKLQQENESLRRRIRTQKSRRKKQTRKKNKYKSLLIDRENALTRKNKEKLDLIKWLESKNQFHYKNGKIEDNYILVSEVLDYIRR